MVIEELKRLYQRNRLVEAFVEPFSDSDLWMVEFKDRQGRFWVLTEPEGEKCMYDDVDTAFQSAMEVGFRQVKIESSIS